MVFCLCGAVRAQQNENKTPGPQPPPAATAEPPGLATGGRLAMDQQRIADKFKRLEEVMLRMAELAAPADPRRAALLRKAVAQSKDRLIAVQFDALVELIKKDQLSRTIANQQELDRDLRALLELLLSENRAKQLESEKARIRQFLKQLNELIKQQKEVQGQTGGAGDPKRLAGDQGRLADKTGRLAKEVKSSESQNNSGAGQSPDKASRPENDQSKPQGEGQSKQAEKTKGPSTPGDNRPAGGDKKGQAQGQGEDRGKGQGQPEKEGQSPAPPPPQDQQNPAHKRLDAAQQRMREAQQKLEDAQREGAVDKQEEALRELERAKANLEEILRQLREEEMERTLAMLETRFLKMLQMQRAVYEGTQRLDKVPQAERNHNHEIEAGRLSGKEAEIVLEADKAMMLLREDGSAVAFPEALAQARQDMQQVVDRLARARVDQVTQGIEMDVISALEEMLQALQQARKNLEDKRQRPPPAQGEPRDPPLVDVIAELRMIRTLQVRVRARTDRYSKLLQADQAQHADLIEALRHLAERQRQIYRITRDLETGKNR